MKFAGLDMLTKDPSHVLENYYAVWAVAAIMLSEGKKEIVIKRSAFEDAYDARLEMSREFDTGSFTIKLL